MLHNDVNDILYEAHDYVNECKKVYKSLENVAAGKARNGEQQWAENMAYHLLKMQANYIYENLQLRLESAGWWKKKVIISYMKDVNTWSRKVAFLSSNISSNR